MPTLDQILGDERFKSQDLDGRLSTIDQYWDKVEQARPEDAPKAQLLRNLSKVGHESGYRSAYSPEGPTKRFYQENARQVDAIYKQAKSADTGSQEFLAALQGYGRFLDEGKASLEEARKNEEQMMQAAENIVGLRKHGEKKPFLERGVTETVGRIFAPGVFREAEKASRSLAQGEPLRVMREAAEKAGVPFKEGDEEKIVERYKYQRGEFSEPFKVGEDKSLFASGEAFLLPKEEAVKKAEASGAARAEIDDFKRNFEARRAAYVKPMIDMHDKLGRREDLERPGKGTVEEQAAEMIRTVRKKVFQNAVAEGLDKTGQFINSVPVLGMFTSKIADPEALAKKEEFFKVLSQYAQDRYDYDFMKSARRAVGGSLPDLALSAIGAGAGTAIGRAAGMTGKTLAGAGVAGSAALPSVKAGGEAYEQAQELGKSNLESLRLAATTFLTEFAPTMLLGRTGKEALLVPGAAREAREGIVKRFAKSAGYEALEEELTFISDLFVNQQALNPDMTLEEAIQGAVDSGVAGAALGLTGGFAPQGPRLDETAPEPEPELPQPVDPDAADLLDGADPALASTQEAAKDVFEAEDTPAGGELETAATPPVGEPAAPARAALTGRERMAEKILISRGVDPEVANQVAPQLTSEAGDTETTEQFRERVEKGFQDKGGMFSGQQLFYTEDASIYEAAGESKEVAEQMAAEAKRLNAEQAETMRQANAEVSERLTQPPTPTTDETLQQGQQTDEEQQGQAPQELGQADQQGDGQPQVTVPEQDAVGQGAEVAPAVEPEAVEGQPPGEIEEKEVAGLSDSGKAEPVTEAAVITPEDEAAPYEVGETLFITDPEGNPTGKADYRGPDLNDPGKSVVWTGKAQISVNNSQLSRNERTSTSRPSEVPERLPTPLEERDTPSASEVPPPSGSEVQEPLPKTKALLIRELIGGKPDATDFERRTTWNKQEKAFQKFTKAELEEKVREKRDFDAKQKAEGALTMANVRAIESELESREGNWFQNLKAIAEENGIEDFKRLSSNTKGEEIYRVASRLAQRGVSAETPPSDETQTTQDQVEETGGLPPVEGEPVGAPPEGQAQEVTQPEVGTASVDPTTASADELRAAADDIVSNAKFVARQIHPVFKGRLNGEAILSPQEAGRVAALRDIAILKEWVLEARTPEAREQALKLLNAAFERFKKGEFRLKGHANSIRNSDSPVFHKESAEAYDLDTEEYHQVGDYWVYGPPASETSTPAAEPGQLSLTQTEGQAQEGAAQREGEGQEGAEVAPAIKLIVERDKGDTRYRVTIPEEVGNRLKNGLITFATPKDAEGNYVVDLGYHESPTAAQRRAAFMLTDGVRTGATAAEHRANMAEHQEAIAPIQQALAEQLAPLIAAPKDAELAKRQAKGTPAIWMGNEVITPRGKYTVRENGKITKTQDLSKVGFEKNLAYLEDIPAAEEGRTWGANDAAKARLAEIVAERQAQLLEQEREARAKRAQEDAVRKQKEAYKSAVEGVKLPKAKKQQVERTMNDGSTETVEMTVIGNLGYRKNPDFRKAKFDSKYLVTHIPTGKGIQGGTKLGTLAEVKTFIKGLFLSEVDLSKVEFSTEETNRMVQALGAHRDGPVPKWFAEENPLEVAPIEEPAPVPEPVETAEEVPTETAPVEPPSISEYRAQELTPLADHAADMAQRRADNTGKRQFLTHRVDGFHIEEVPPEGDQVLVVADPETTPASEPEPPEPRTAAPEPSPEAPPRQPELTGVKFEALDKELKALGYENGIARRPAGTNQEAFDAARAQFEAEVPEGEMDAGTKLIDDLIREPRGWKDEVELNLARLEIFRRKAEMGRAAKAMFTAKSNKLSKEDQKSLRSLYDGAEMRLHAAMRAAAYAQSTWGKTGRVSQDWLAEDFTLVDLATRWRAVVNDGAPLTDGTNGTRDQIKEVADAYEKIKQQQAQLAMLEEALENATEENKDLVAAMDLLVADVERAQKKGARTEKLRKAFDEKAAEARKRIEARRQGPPPEEGDTTVLAAGLMPESAEDIKDYAIIGASYLAKKFVGLGEFTSRMVQEFGEKVLPLVSRVYRESLALYHETYSSVRGEDTNPEPTAIVDGIDPDEGPTKRDVWALARAHVIRGLRGDNVLNAVHSDLQESFPDLTRDEVAKLFTGYGTTIEPSKEETEVELNKLRNLERTGLKIKDVLRGEAPKRTGFQRGEQDVEVREKEREFRRLLKESGIQTTDEATQLRTALGAAKRRMQNEIEAYEKAIAENEKRPDTGRSTLEYDEEATRLKSKLEEVRADYNRIFREGPTMDQRQEMVLKNLDRRIKDEEQMIKDGVFARPKGEPVLETPEIAARREKLAELREQRRRLDPSQTPLAQAKASTSRAIERLMEMLRTGAVAVKERRQVDPDAELEAMLEVKQALQDEVRELRRMLPGSPARERAQIERALKASEESARRIEEKLRTGDLTVKPKRETAASRNAAVQAARARVKELNKELARRRREALPKKSPEEIRVNRALASLRRQKKELERRIAQNDYSPRVKPKPVNDQRVRDAREEVEKLKREVNTQMLEAKLAQRNAVVKLAAGVTDAIFRLPRAIQTSIDAGAFGRQGWLAWLAHPAVTSKQFSKNFAFTEKRAAKAEQELEDNPLYQTALDAGLSLTSWRPGHSFAEMEEMYRSRIARKVPGVVQSERSYVTYLNAVRMAHFDLLYKALEAKEGGLDAEGVNLKKIARHINSMTGRGNLGSWERAAEPLATLLFSPKYWWSRLEMLGGMAYSAADAASGFRLGKDEDLIARKIIAKERGRIALGLTAMYSLVAAAASMLGDDEEPEATVTFNPLTTDFGKIKFSNGTRIDPGAGLLQNVVFPMQMAFGKRISSVTGDEIDFVGDDKTGRQTRLSESGRMLRKKLAPVPSSVADLWDEKDILGRPVLPESETVGMFIPISMSEAYESYTDLGLSKGTAATLLNLFGFGTSTYGGDVQESISLERRGAELVGGILGLPPERYDRFHK